MFTRKPLIVYNEAQQTNIRNMVILNIMTFILIRQWNKNTRLETFGEEPKPNSLMNILKVETYCKIYITQEKHPNHSIGTKYFNLFS